MSPDEVVQALAAGNTVSPSGNVRIGDLLPMVPVNSVVGDFRGLSDIPIRSQGTQTIFIRDVGSVEDGADIQTGYALVDGRRTVYIPVTKRADASTLAVVQAVKANLPRFQSVLPDDVQVSYQFDQSPYVTRAIQGLFFEGALGAVLTGLMVLLFLRDWRSSLVVVLNIPLAILASVTALWVSGQTINIMTLGGLALAVGILVDEATVTIENIHTHLADGRGLARAASEATAETTVPRFVAMLCILGADDQIGRHDDAPSFHDGAREPIVPGSQPIEERLLRRVVLTRIVQHPDRQHRHKGTGKQIRPHQ
jgi:multidrug efflux pump subunit AcrB